MSDEQGEQTQAISRQAQKDDGHYDSIDYLLPFRQSLIPILQPVSHIPLAVKCRVL